MQLYHYDDNGLFCGVSGARLDTLESERQGRMVFIRPARSTDVALPTLAEKQTARWMGDAWEIVPDRRGETWFQFRTPVRIASVGDPAADGLTPEPAPWTLDEAKVAKIAGLREEAAQRIVGGFVSEALGAPHTYPNTQTDQQNLAASVVASLLLGHPADWTTPFWCADVSGAWAFAPHTAAQIQRVGADAQAFIVAVQAELAVLTDRAMAAQSVEELGRL